MFYILAFFNLINTYVVFDYLERMYTRLYEGKRLYYAVFVAFFVLHFFANLLQNVMVNAFYAVFSLQAVGMLFYQDSPRRTVYNFLFAAYLIFTDILSFAILEFFFEQSSMLAMNKEAYMVFAMTVNYVIVIFSYRTLIRHFFKENIDNNMFIRKNIFFFSLLLFEIFIMVYFWSLDVESSRIVVSFVAMGFIFLDCYLVGLLEYVFCHGKMKQEISCAQRQIEELDNDLSDIQVKYKATRKFVHDARGHLRMLESLYQSGDAKLADKYKAQIGCNIERTGVYMDTGSRFVDLMLDEYKAAAEAAGIRVNFLVQDFDWSFLTEYEAQTMFGNLLNNAMEACGRVAKGGQYIDLFIAKRFDMITISLRNSCDLSSLQKVKEGYQSSKPNHEGIGLQNIKDIVDARQGTMMITARDNQFGVNICLLARAEEAP